MDIPYPKLNEESGSRNFYKYGAAGLGDVLKQDFLGGIGFGVNAANVLGTRIESVFETKTLTPEEYKNSQFFREGIEIPQEGIKESIARITAENYDKRYKRNLTLDRARQTLGTGAARFGVGLAGGILDPLNIAVGLATPVLVGANATARAISAKAVNGVTTKYGVTAGRVAAGVGEGVVGSAAVEPLMLYSATVVQDPEYGLFDSFVNLTAGAIFGGTLAGVGGKFSDRIKNARLETKTQAIRAAIFQQIEGKKVDVTPIINADPEIGPRERAELEILEREAWERMSDGPEMLATPLSQIIKPKDLDTLPPSIRRAFDIIKSGPRKGEVRKPESIIQFIKRMGGVATDDPLIGDLNQVLGSKLGVKGVPVGFRKSSAKGGRRLDDLAMAAWEEGYFGVGTERPTPDDLIQAIDDDLRSGGVRFSEIDPDVELYNAAILKAEMVERLGIDPRGMTDAELDAELELRQNNMTAEEQFNLERVEDFGLNRDEIQTLIDDAELSADNPQAYLDVYDSELEAESLAEFDKLRKDDLQEADHQRMNSDDSYSSQLDKENQRLEMQLQALMANIDLPEEELLILREIDSAIEDYDNIESVMQAGAQCLIGGK